MASNTSRDLTKLNDEYEKILKRIANAEENLKLSQQVAERTKNEIQKVENEISTLTVQIQVTEQQRSELEKLGEEALTKNQLELRKLNERLETLCNVLSLHR
jgi:hypothetical protein